VRVCVKPGKALSAKVGPDRLQLSTGQGGKGESKTWEEKRSEQPGRPYGSAASYAPCFPTAVRALLTRLIHRPRSHGWGLCYGPHGQRSSECSLPACSTARPSPACQTGISSCTRGHFSPYFQFPEPGSTLAQRGRDQYQFPSANCPASRCSTFSHAELSCNFLVTVRAAYSSQHWAVNSRRHPERRGSDGALVMLVPCAAAAPASHRPLGCSGAAAGVSPEEQLMNTGRSPPSPKQLHHL